MALDVFKEDPQFRAHEEEYQVREWELGGWLLEGHADCVHCGFRKRGGAPGGRARVRC